MFPLCSQGGFLLHVLSVLVFIVQMIEIV